MLAAPATAEQLSSSADYSSSAGPSFAQLDRQQRSVELSVDHLLQSATTHKYPRAHPHCWNLPDPGSLVGFASRDPQQIGLLRDRQCERARLFIRLHAQGVVSAGVTQARPRRRRSGHARSQMRLDMIEEVETRRQTSSISVSRTLAARTYARPHKIGQSESFAIGAQERGDAMVLAAYKCRALHDLEHTRFCDQRDAGLCWALRRRARRGS
jgi:hypothetical protein